MRRGHSSSLERIIETTVRMNHDNLYVIIYIYLYLYCWDFGVEMCYLYILHGDKLIKMFLKKKKKRTVTKQVV